MGVAHREPLGPRALAILDEMKTHRVNDYIFPGRKKDSPLSDMTMVALMRRMNVAAVPHGMRSTFRDWIGDATSFDETLAEIELAHQVGDETERAYRRGDALEKRRRMMLAWERFILGGGAAGVTDARADMALLVSRRGERRAATGPAQDWPDSPDPDPSGGRSPAPPSGGRPKRRSSSSEMISCTCSETRPTTRSRPAFLISSVAPAPPDWAA